MLTDKTYVRTARGHFLVNVVLNAFVVSRAFEIPLHPTEELKSKVDIQKALEVYDDVLSEKVSEGEASLSKKLFSSISQTVDAERRKCSNHLAGKH